MVGSGRRLWLDSLKILEWGHGNSIEVLQRGGEFGHPSIGNKKDTTESTSKNEKPQHSIRFQNPCQKGPEGSRGKRGRSSRKGLQRSQFVYCQSCIKRGYPPKHCLAEDFEACPQSQYPSEMIRMKSATQLHGHHLKGSPPGKTA